MIRPDRVWPVAILLSAAFVGALAVGGAGPPLQPIATLAFLAVCPWMAVIRLLQLEDVLTELTLAVAFSIALGSLVAGIMLYAGLWSSTWALGLLLGVSVIGAAWQLRPARHREITIPLNEYQNSGVSGTATLAADGRATRVAMELSGEQVTGNHPTYIHTGTCADFDPDPTYPLTAVILSDVSNAGVSETTVEDVRLRDLLASDYVILVHKSAEELTNYFVCGDIKSDSRTGGSRNDTAAIV